MLYPHLLQASTAPLVTMATGLDWLQRWTVPRVIRVTTVHSQDWPLPMVSVSLDTTASWPLMPQTQQMNRGATGARLGTTAHGGLPALSHVKWAPTSQMWVSWSRFIHLIWWCFYSTSCLYIVLCVSICIYCVCVCVCACVRACVRARARVCMCMWYM